MLAGVSAMAAADVVAVGDRDGEGLGKGAAVAVVVLHADAVAALGLEVRHGDELQGGARGR